jgi:radical SAM protein with 4Fe4S-binding SPASM domain
MISTNGDYLTQYAFEDLYNAGLNQLQINMYSYSSRNMINTWNRCAERLGVDTDGPIYQYISPRRRTMDISPKYDIDAFRNTKGPFALVNRAGNIPDFLPPRQINAMCTKPFRFLNISWNGETLLCCNDYYNEVKIGNVADKSVLDLWRSPILRHYRERLIEKDRSLPVCNRCDFNGGVYQWNVKLED